jgi:hypothetical protein
MRHRAGATLVAVLLAALLPSLAVAKGPVEATLEGPGLAAPIEFGGWTEADPWRAPIEPLATAAGFFPAAFGGDSGLLGSKPPTGDLGPRYTVTYGLGGPEDGEERIVQAVYPYAQPHPVTYMAPDQPFYGTMSTRGGWFVATSPLAPPLAYVLREAGLPRDPPTGGDPGTFPWTIAVGLAVLVTMLGLAALTLLLLRRRLHPAT